MYAPYGIYRSVAVQLPSHPQFTNKYTGGKVGVVEKLVALEEKSLTRNPDTGIGRTRFRGLASTEITITIY